MAMYTDFAGYYEDIFPLRDGTVGFLEKWLPSAGQLLDLGCGTGHYCTRLGGPDGRCEGADPDPGMIERARELEPGNTYRLMGMEGIGALPAAMYAGVFCIGNVLPHMAVTELPAFLERLRNVLQPGGVWIFQTVNFDRLLDFTDYEFPVIRHDERGLTFRRSYRDITADHLEFHTRLADRGGRIFASAVDLHPRSSIQYRALHENAGFELVEHVADWSGHPFASASSDGSVFVWRRNA
ncbi:MAG: class I SAM-dependent methyltransferase [bacterium]|nr:class I SAM-dependent methyltransferase [bacterium]